MAAPKKTPQPAEVPDAADIASDFVDDEIWAYEPAGPSLIVRMVAELAGTFILVLLGVGTALYSSFTGNGSLTVGLAFGVAVIIAATIFGATSGAHLNPAVTVGVWLSGRFAGRDVAPYFLAQVVGAAAAGSVLYLIATSNSTWNSIVVGEEGATARQTMSVVSNGFGEHSPSAVPDIANSGFGLGIAIGVEVIATGLLVAVILAATSVKASKTVAPFTIALSLTLLIVWAIPFTAAALNPARATATAIYAEPWALQQLWVFWVAPLIGAAIVGLLYRAFSPDEEFETVEVLESIKD